MRSDILIEERRDDRERPVQRDERDQQLEIVLVPVVHQIDRRERREVDVAQAVHDAVERGVLDLPSPQLVASAMQNLAPVRARELLDAVR